MNMQKRAVDDPISSYALTGRLVLSKSGWLLLEVPNAIVHGLFAAMHAPGIQLPTDENGKLNAHISVMRKEEVSRIGASKISETGKQFRFQIGQLKEVSPISWDGVSKVWFVEAKSPELEALRKSYGLPALPTKGSKELPFHITVAIRRTKILYANEMTKLSETIMDMTAMLSETTQDDQST